MKDSVNIDEILREGIRMTDFIAVSGIKYGWNRKSAGCKIRDRGGTINWFKVQYRSSECLPDKLWFGEADTVGFVNIRKPKLISSIEWMMGNFVCRGGILQYVPFTACSQTPQLT